MRTTAGVILGYMGFAILAGVFYLATGRDPHAAQPLWFTGLSTVYGLLIALGAGATSQFIARTPRLIAPLIVAGIMAAIAIASIVASRGTDHTSQLLAALIFAPTSIAGGAIAQRIRARSN